MEIHALYLRSDCTDSGLLCLLHSQSAVASPSAGHQSQNAAAPQRSNALGMHCPRPMPLSGGLPALPVKPTVAHEHLKSSPSVG